MIFLKGAVGYCRYALRIQKIVYAECDNAPIVKSNFVPKNF